MSYIYYVFYYITIIRIRVSVLLCCAACDGVRT